MSDALISGAGTLEGRPVHICAMELKFIGGSMGAVVGEKITRAIERGLARQQPVPASLGTLETHKPLFAGLLVGVIIILVGLTYFPALALGPFAEGLH